MSFLVAEAALVAGLVSVALAFASLSLGAGKLTWSPEWLSSELRPLHVDRFDRILIKILDFSQVLVIQFGEVGNPVLG